MSSVEGFLDLGGRRTWYRTFGEPTDKAPLLLLHGGPGGASANDIPFVDVVARDRLVVQYDQLDSGRSWRLGDPAALTVAGFVHEIDDVRAALGLDEVHVWGQSWGGSLALAYALSKPAGLRSVINASGFFSTRREMDAVNELRAGLPETTLFALLRCEETLSASNPKPHRPGRGPSSASLAHQADLAARYFGVATSAPVQATLRAASYVPFLRRHVYPALLLEFVTRHVLRARPVPAGLIVQSVGLNVAVYEHMWGPFEHVATGELHDFELTDRLHEIDVPLLMTSGAHESVLPAHVAELVERVPSAEAVLFEYSAHCAEFEEPERYTAMITDFLRRVEVD